MLFINDAPTEKTVQNVNGSARRNQIRAQAARASSNARLETIRRRAAEREGAQQPGTSGGRLTTIRVSEPLPRTAVERHRRAVIQHQQRDTSTTLHSHTPLGGSIPPAQANLAILSQFLNRFKSGDSAERPWIELVSAEATSSSTPSLVARALQANAAALCANDLRRPEIRRHATKLYLATITRLQSSLRSESWHEPVVLYTCMIVSLYEYIGSGTPSAQRAHVNGVAQLIEQKGPRSFTSGLEHKTFRYYRINLLMMYLADRQPCFLAEPAWKIIPFSGDCPPKTVLDLLIDILIEIPGVLAAAEALRKGQLSQYAMLQKASELTYWVRSLMSSLERWKQACMWTFPSMRTALNIRNLDLLALCNLAVKFIPYDARLGEALNCYMAAHLILARIAQRLSETSFLMRAALHPPHTLRDLVAGIVVVSARHISSSEMAGMISMMVTTFPLKVAQSTTEVVEPALLERAGELLGKLNEHFVRRYNIRYSVDGESGAYEV